MHIGGRGPIHIYIEYREKTYQRGEPYKIIRGRGTPKFFVGGKSDPRGQTKME